MSSARFETELRIREGLRRFVLLSGALLMLAGTVILMHLPLPAYIRALVLVAWLWQSIEDLSRQSRGTARVRHLLLDADGRLFARGRDGRVMPLTLLSGSLVGERLAWLRLRFGDGTHYGELLAGDPRRDRAWHRLRLCWQQRHGAFGRAE